MYKMCGSKVYLTDYEYRFFPDPPFLLGEDEGKIPFVDFVEIY
jgi:hypothetical protein